MCQHILNAAVVAGSVGGRFYPDPVTREYGYGHEPVHLLMKVETRNHPTAIAPFSGAGTGSEEKYAMRVYGTGSKPKAGLVTLLCLIYKFPIIPSPGKMIMASLSACLGARCYD